jgi:hypothetical protein
VHGESVDERVQALGFKRGRQAGVGMTGGGERL